jgi:hypothetical protein
MDTRQLLAISAFTAFFLVQAVAADEGRYVTENGVTYYDVYRVVPRAITETASQQTTRTVYKVECATETRDVTRTWYCPVVVYRPESELIGRWNPFVEPYWETQWVADTQWVPHSDVVKMPVTTRKLIPQTQTVQVPVTSQKIVYENVLVSRMAVSGVPMSPSAPQGPVPRPNPPTAAPQSTTILYQPPQPGEPIGGIARLSQDPPRQSTSPTGPTTTR